jgi:hypothetical protein
MGAERPGLLPQGKQHPSTQTPTSPNLFGGLVFGLRDVGNFFQKNKKLFFLKKITHPSTPTPHHFDGVWVREQK